MTGERLAHKWQAHLRCQRVWDRAMGARRRRIPILPGILWWVLRAVFAAELPMWRERPRELYLMHNGLGVVIHPDTRFNGPAIVFHQVTLGNAWTAGADGAPTIGRYVFIGTGAKILGAVIIGDYSVVGANAVVTRNVPACHMASGNPAQNRPIDKNAMLATMFDLSSPGASRRVGHQTGGWKRR